jgi:protein Tex
VFADNLRDLLLAAPAGPKAILGLDPGLRTGVKVAVVDRTGKLLDTATIYPHVPREDWVGSLATLAALCKRHQVTLIAIGNGTASRETDKLASELVQEAPGAGHAEAGRQRSRRVGVLGQRAGGEGVPRTGRVAARRGVDRAQVAGSVGRTGEDRPQGDRCRPVPARCQPGQAGATLDAVVEDCVNHVGVDLNTASDALLSRVAGLSPALAKNIVAHRDENGPFLTRKELLKVSRLGPKAFEQAAGFLRIQGGENPLDSSAVHPEAYPVVERILQRTGKDIKAVLGNRECCAR